MAITQRRKCEAKRGQRLADPGVGSCGEEGGTPRQYTVCIAVKGIEKGNCGDFGLTAALLKAFVLLRHRLRQHG